MNITVDSLVAAGIGPFEAVQFVDHLNEAAGRFGLTTAARFGAFLGQAMVESVKLTRLEENLNYSSAQRIAEVFPGQVAGIGPAQRLVNNPQALALTVYSNRRGNGDWSTGDGWKFRGSGIFQLTGRTWFTRLESDLGEPYLEQPDLVRQPRGACMSAGWYWQLIDGNSKADHGDLAGITHAINPAMLQADQRQKFALAAQEAFA